MREGCSALNKAIKIGRVDVGVAESAHDLVAHIIGKNEQDVGFRFVRILRLRGDGGAAIEQNGASRDGGDA